jgi:hypothetical protein
MIIVALVKINFAPLRNRLSRLVEFTYPFQSKNNETLIKMVGNSIEGKTLF